MKHISRRSLFLLVFDGLFLGICFHLAAYWQYAVPLELIVSAQSLLLVFLIYLLCLYVFDLYFPFKIYKPAQTLIDVGLACVCAAVLVSAAWFFNRSLAVPRVWFLVFNVLAIPSIVIVRLVYDVFFQSRIADKKTLVLGTGLMAGQILKVIQETPHSGIHLVGVVADDKDFSDKEFNGVPVVGQAAQLLSLIDWHHVELVVLAVEAKSNVSEPELMMALMRQNVQVTSAVHLFEKMDEAIPFEAINEHFILSLMSEARSLRYLHTKRIFDLMIVSVLLLLFSPVMVLAWLFLFFQGPGNIFFLQDRIGMGGAKFRLIKFRTMTKPDASGRQKVTGVGRWLRKFRVDETPQLINVLKGDMSLIGPRPEIEYFVERCRKMIPFYDAVFTVRPGITGWAQVKFLHTTELKDYPRKFCYNLFYLKNLSFSLDFLIVLKTVRVVLLGRGK